MRQKPHCFARRENFPLLKSIKFFSKWQDMEDAAKALEGPQAHAIGLCWCMACLRQTTRCNGCWR